jgi:prolyl oligopeptidase PreP (S9A serine peptidase family)
MDDPFQDLEDVGSPSSRSFVNFANEMCMKAHGDPTKSSTSTYSKILKYLESDDRIPLVSKMGKDKKGQGILFNLWKDSKVGW